MMERKPLTVSTLAEALYEGTSLLSNLAEELARQYGKASALCFFSHQGEEVKNFWRHIACELIEHSREWEKNEGSGCVLSKKERERLKRIVNAL